MQYPVVVMFMVLSTIPDAASLYLFSSGDVQLYEVKAFQEEFHSWFIGQTVQRGLSHEC